MTRKSCSCIIWIILIQNFIVSFPPVWTWNFNIMTRKSCSCIIWIILIQNFIVCGIILQILAWWYAANTFVRVCIFLGSGHLGNNKLDQHCVIKYELFMIKVGKVCLYTVIGIYLHVFKDKVIFEFPTKLYSKRRLNFSEVRRYISPWKTAIHVSSSNKSSSCDSVTSVMTMLGLSCIDGFYTY